MTQNEKAFLDMIAWAELGPELIKLSDNGFNVIVGSTPNKPILFHDYSDHPRVYVKPMRSTAAGAFQILKRYFDYYKVALELPDFGHDSQRKIALQMIKECKALEDINSGWIQRAIVKTKSRWASFPGADYGQHEHKMEDLLKAYQSAGGMLAK